MNLKNVQTNVKPRLLAVSVAAGLMGLSSGAYANMAYVAGTTTNVAYISIGNLDTRTPQTPSANNNKDSLGATGRYGIAIGYGPTATEQGSIAIGTVSRSAGNGSTALGAQSKALATSATALGNLAEARGNADTAIGRRAIASGGASAALGQESRATGNYAGAFGSAATAGGQASTAIGLRSTASAQSSVAFGTRSAATATNAIALGSNAQAAHANSVALGANSVTAAAVGTNSATVGNLTYGGFAGTNPGSTVSVGSAGAERTITNVAAGRINATSTDAVNGSQLYSVAQQVDTNATNITNLGNQINNIGGNVTQQINNVYQHVGDLDKDLRAGIAGATAIGFLQRPNEAGKSLVSAAVGGYRNQQALAVGYAHNSDNNKWSTKFGVGVNTRKDVNWGASLGYQW